MWNMSEYVSSAQMDFTGDSDKTFKWTANETASTQELGSRDTNAGTLSSKELKMTMKNGIKATLTFTVTEITISNPSTIAS